MLSTAVSMMLFVDNHMLMKKSDGCLVLCVCIIMYVLSLSSITSS